jgi:hypothetical protein
VFTPKTRAGWRKRLRDEVNYRAQVGYTRYFLPGRFFRRYEMPNPWPWALHPLLQAPSPPSSSADEVDGGSGEVGVLPVEHAQE